MSANDTQYTTNSDVTITVTPTPSSELQVSAGPNQTATFPATITLNGTVTDASSAAANLSVNWSQVIGSGTTTFASPHAAVTTASFSDPGTYELQLSASDGLVSGSSQATVLCAEHVRQLGGESPLHNLMEVK